MWWLGDWIRLILHQLPLPRKSLKRGKIILVSTSWWEVAKPEKAVWDEKTASLLYPVGRDGEWEDMAEILSYLLAEESSNPQRISKKIGGLGSGEDGISPIPFPISGKY